MIVFFLKRLYRRLRLGSVASSSDHSKAQNYLDYLRGRGCQIGENPKILGQVIIDDNHCWHILIGNNVTIAPRVYILAHDASTKYHTGFTYVAPVRIGDGVFIGASAIILPGVTIGDGAIVGAGAVVSRDVPAGAVVAGVPAKVVGSAQATMASHLERLRSAPSFDSRYTIERQMTESMRSAMVEAIQAFGYGYVE
jgi:maltose O-acetyltransferase